MIICEACECAFGDQEIFDRHVCVSDDNKDESAPVEYSSPGSEPEEPGA